jgi:hypothetical protein
MRFRTLFYLLLFFSSKTVFVLPVQGVGVALNFLRKCWITSHVEDFNGASAKYDISAAVKGVARRAIFEERRELVNVILP